MTRKVLVYQWGSLSEPSFCRALQSMKIEYEKFPEKMSNYHSDALFAKKMIDILHEKNIGIVFSYDYFPLISMICDINEIPYVSWIYDCPQYTLLSKTITGKYNYIFCFDSIFTERLRKLGAVHCYHFPLAGDGDNERKVKECRIDQYQCDISFVGNLYNEKKNRLRKIKLNSYFEGYVEGLIQAQLKVYGYNFLKEAVIDDLIREIILKCDLELGKEYLQDYRQMVADVLGMEVTAREREMVVRKIAQNHVVTLFTSSKLPEAFESPNIRKMGYADYETEVPLIYHSSKINLNVTSRTIESGIPQRIIDILSCGGFCLTNYQPEVGEYFADGEEIVMYSSMEDMVNKIDYYLIHEEERKQIAIKGHEKFLKCFELKNRIADMLNIANSASIL